MVKGARIRLVTNILTETGQNRDETEQKEKTAL